MRWRVGLLAALLLAGCDSRESSNPSIPRIENAWVRAADSCATTAAYLTLFNDANGPYSIVAATGSLCDDIQMHETVHDGALSRMRETTLLIAPPHGRLEFKPGGNHLMLIGLRHKLIAGQMTHFTLLLQNGSTIIVDADVRE